MKEKYFTTSGTKGKPTKITDISGMRKLLLPVKRIMIYFLLLTIFFLSGSVTNAQRTASVSGNWFSTATWGGQSVPTRRDAVTINSGVTVTVDGGAFCASITINAPIAATGIIIGGNYSLDVSGSITAFAPTNNNITTIAVGSGYLAVAGNIALTSGIGTREIELSLSSGTIDVFGSITFSGNPSSAKLTFTGPGTLNIEGNLGTGGTLTAGSGTVNFLGAVAQLIGDYTYNNLILSGSGAKTTTGASVNGILSMEANATTTGTAPTYGTSATLQYKGSAAQTTGTEFPATFSGTGGVIINNSNGVTFNAAKTITHMLSMTSGTLDIANSDLTAGSLSGSGNITNLTGSPGAVTLTLGSDNTNTSYNGIISNGTATSVAVIKNGTGTLTLSGANSYSGATTVAAGVLNIQNATALGTTAGNTTISIGAALELQGGITIGAEALSLSGTGISANGALRSINGNNTWSGQISLGANTTIRSDAGILTLDVTSGNGITGTYDLSFEGAGNITVTDPIATSTGTLTKNGAGILTLSGDNTYAGLTTISSGTLKLGATGGTTDTPLGTTGAGTIVSSGAVLDLNGFTLGTGEALALDGTGISNGGALVNSSLTAASYSGDITLVSASSIGTIGDITSSGIISGGQALTKVGSGTLILSGNNTFSGGFIISAGTVQLGAANRITTQPVTLDGGTFSTGTTAGFNETVGTLTLTNNSTIALGTGIHTLTFSASNGIPWTSGKVLTITGWKGTPPGTSGTEGRVFFGSSNTGLTIGQLDMIIFLVNGNNYSATILSDGEVVPTSSVSITTGTITGSPFCAGASVSVPYTINGSFGSGNVFTAQLSDVTGSFSSPSIVGTLTSTLAGSISGTIPIGTQTGTGYRIRVISSTPSVDGSDNGTGLTVNATLSVVSISPSGAQSICTSGTGILLTSSETGGLLITSRQWGKRSVSGGTITPITGATGNTYLPTAADLGTGTWYVVCTSTPSCGSPTVSNEVIVTVVDSGGWLGVNSNWSDPLNWCGGVLPGFGSDVVIPSTPNQPIVGSAALCRGLTINSGASLTINSGLTVIAAVINGGTLIVNSGGVAVMASTLTNSGTIIVNSGGQASTSLALTNNTGAILTLNGGSQVSLDAGLVNNGTLNLNSDASGIASLKLNSYSGSGVNNIQLFLTGGGGNNAWKWHYISSPVAGTNISTFNGNTTDLARYDESLVSTSQNDGWIAADGYIYKDGSTGTGFPTLSLGSGYAYYFGSNQTYTISGPINASAVGLPLAYNTGGSGNVNIIGFNLVGNPFTCSLNWDVVASSNSLPSAGISSAIYSTKDYNLSPTYVPGGPNPGTDGGTNTIPPMQAFFVEALATGQSLTLPVSAKTHSATPRFKGNSDNEVVPLVRLLLKDGNNSRDALIWFNEKATLSFDNSFDAYKLNKSLGPINLWTKLGGIDYAINGMSFPETTIEIPVGIHAETGGIYSLLSNELNGLENYTVTLKDKSTNTTLDLKSGKSLIFLTQAGDFEDRFILKITNITTGTEEIKLNENLFNIFAFNGMLNIQLLSDSWNGKQGVVKLTDLTGRAIRVADNVEFWKNSLVQIPIPGAKGLYIVEIRSGTMRYTGKVVVR